MIELIQGDCLEKMENIKSGSVDLVLTDPPYGTTACKWDSIIDLDLMWEQLKRIIKKNGAIILFGTEPFSSLLRCSNLKMFRYDLIWRKSHSRGFLNSWRQPMRKHENINIFYRKQPTYNPILTDKEEKNIRPNSKRTRSTQFNGGEFSNEANKRKCPTNKSMPSSILEFNSKVTPIIHPTQKPVALMEYLIKTYTNKGETILDFTMGSGTTGVACRSLNRSFIGIEKDPEYFKIAKGRINAKMET